MALRHSARLALALIAATGLCLGAAVATVVGQEDSSSSLTVDSGRVSLAGTSNIHAYTASTSAIRVTRVLIVSGLAGPGFWDGIVAPGAVEAFDIAIPAATLASPKGDLDKNMHKALKVTEHPDIVFRLRRLEPRPGAPGGLRGIGTLLIAGVEREVALELTTERKEASLTVRGQLPLLMTDYGIKPPTAMLGMLKTDPKVTVTFEVVLVTPKT
jgi:hypothetical protein